VCSSDLEAARTLLESCGVQPDLRAEALSAQDFLRLAEAVGTTPEGRSP
jgi:16S rRNA A1518/A1519 N6-dimethyltransferase RsmA/KsgA/DIM1 with predicted DNA glycosylase/AP lyase activity